MSLTPTGRFRVGVTLHVMVNLAAASAAVLGATVGRESPTTDAPVADGPPLAAFVASAPVAWSAPPVVPPPPPPVAADVAVGADPAVPPEDADTAAASLDAAVSAEVGADVSADVSSGGARVVLSTAYCLDGVTASGERTGPGGVAMNGVPLGSSWRVLDGSLAGSTLTVNDRIGRGSEFDVWFDDCAAARAYGRQTISVVQGA